MARSSRWPGRLAGLIGVALAATFLVACDGEEEAPPPSGATLAERWIRAGEENTAAVSVYERALPPYLVDLLNPDADADTPPEDLIAFPVHPEGNLLGSYVLRRADGSQVAWLFYDVPATTMGDVIDTVSSQLDETPWQVLSQSGSRSNRLISFESTRNEDITGNAIAERTPGSADFTVVVERGEEEVTLTIPRGAVVPLIEATFNNSLVVQDVFPGFARAAGLQEDDQVIRVGETEVTTPEGLQRALEGLASEPGTISLLYLIQFAPPLQVETPPFVPASGLSLPSDFPARDAWAAFDLDSFEAAQDPTGEYYFAALFTLDTPSTAATQVRDALEAAGWEITADEAAGFGTTLEFAHEGDELVGFASIDESGLDDSLTQILVQIQPASSFGP
ncbi:MAG: hypothetical protein AB7F65_10670 [Dehalococcoidia bacterium]